MITQHTLVLKIVQKLRLFHKTITNVWKNVLENTISIICHTTMLVMLHINVQTIVTLLRKFYQLEKLVALVVVLVNS